MFHLHGIRGRTCSSRSDSQSDIQSDSQSLWLIRRKSFNPGMSRLIDTDVVTSTEIALGFQFHSKEPSIDALCGGYNYDDDIDTSGMSEAQEPRFKGINIGSTDFSLPRVDGKNSASAVDYTHIELRGKKTVRLCGTNTFPVYAFLPTKASIFPFVIQGDFVLPTNRESLMEGNVWNQTLLHQVRARTVCRLIGVISVPCLLDRAFNFLWCAFSSQ